ncbi:MAG TPA: hypothetical protein VIG99_28835 [Myxococcaceae bacterium]|jgi:hypothetical protein
MCYRLLAAVDPPIAPGEWRALATHHGLDLRVDETSPEVRFAEISMGDCACSLYTRREGRLRTVALVEAFLDQRRSVQLLLMQDGEEIRWETRAPAEVALPAFRESGLQSLPEGSVAAVVRAGTDC